MNRGRWAFALLGVMASGWLCFFFSRPGVVSGSRESGVLPNLAGPVPKSVEHRLAASSPAKGDRPPKPSSAPAAQVTDQEVALQRIETAVVTYAVASLPTITPLLTHPDGEIRLAAREGLLRMGLSEAAPALREAAGEVSDPREAVLLLDAADFLELPTLPSTGNRRRDVLPPRPPVAREGRLWGK